MHKLMEELPPSPGCKLWGSLQLGHLLLGSLLLSQLGLLWQQQVALLIRVPALCKPAVST